MAGDLKSTLAGLFGAPEPGLWAEHVIERAVQRALADEYVMRLFVHAVVVALKPPADTDPDPESEYLVPPEIGPGDYVKLFGANPMDVFQVKYVTEDRKALVAYGYGGEDLFRLDRISEFRKAATPTTDPR